MGSRSKGGYKEKLNDTGQHWLGPPPKKLVLKGKRHRRYRQNNKAKPARVDHPS